VCRVAEEQVTFLIEHVEDEDAIAIAAACCHAIGGSAEERESEFGQVITLQQSAVELAIGDVRFTDVLLATIGDGATDRLCLCSTNNDREEEWE
jgi:hypothetical protein